MLAALLGGGCAAQSANSVTAPRTRPRVSTEAPILIKVQPSRIAASWGQDTHYFVKGVCGREGTRQRFSSVGAARLIDGTVGRVEGPIRVEVTADVDEATQRSITDALDALDRGYALTRGPVEAPEPCPKWPGTSNSPPRPGEPRIGTSSTAASRPKLSKPGVAKVIRADLSGFKRCYEERLKVRPSAAGAVTVWFLIGGDGKVVRVEVLEDTVDAKVSQCVQQTTAGLHFPRRPGGAITSVTYPFIFATR